MGGILILQVKQSNTHKDDCVRHSEYRVLLTMNIAVYLGPPNRPRDLERNKI
jgi:hypothetical protein